MRVPSNHESSMSSDPTLKTDAEKVADNISQVVDVSNNMEPILRVDANEADIKTVSVNAASVNAVAAIAHAVSTLATNLDNIDTVVANLAEILHIEQNLAELLVLHARMSALLDIHGSLGNIDAVAANESNINAVYEAIPEIATVVSHMADIHYIHAHEDELEAIFNNLAALLALGTYIDSVVVVADNIEVILEASTYVGEINENLAKIEVIEQNVIALEASATESEASAAVSASASQASALGSANSASESHTDMVAAEAAKSAAESAAEQAEADAASTASDVIVSNANAAQTAADAATVANHRIEIDQLAQETAASEASAEASALSASTDAAYINGEIAVAVDAKNTAVSSASDAADSALISANDASQTALDVQATAASEVNAATSANTAETKATEAANSASSANTSKNAAEAAELGSVTAKNQAQAAQAASESVEVNVQVSATSATASANAATTSEGNAAQSASDASGSANTATVKASEAEASAVRAEEATATLVVMSASEHDAILAQNEEKYAASGMIHMGRTRADANYTPNLINEGMTTRTNSTLFPNGVLMGDPAMADTNGTSKTEFPVSHIAGAVSNLTRINTNNYFVGCYLMLPPAPNGTVIYDSTGDARGTGKANLDLLNEIDPKYGDIAATQNEAVARAFEGSVKNGDFRFGDDGSWLPSVGDGNTIAITNGNLNINKIGAHWSLVQQLERLTVGDEYVFSFYCDVVGQIFVDGQIYFNTTVGYNTLTFVAQRSLFSIQTSINGNYNFKHVSVKPVTEEVVTDRVDMFGLEQFDMVMKDDEVFDMVQSQSTTFGDTDVPTVDSVRPDSFFAVYDGQTGISKGKCVKWSTLTDVQKRKVAAYMKERLWVNEDGDLTFTSIRQRSFAGAGNGDWDYIDSNEGTPPLQSHGPYTRKMPQGALDTYPEDSYSNGYQPFAGAFSIAGGVKGVFSEGESIVEPTGSHKGRCFFYVLGTCSRLNQGAYHPSLNPSGTKGWRNGAGATDTVAWFNTTKQDFNLADCFAYLPSGSQETGGSSFGGQIGSSTIGRDFDGRFYDAIYADGLGGVVDYRLPAYESDSPEESAKAWEKVKNGTYRGLEKLVAVNMICANGTSTYSGAIGQINLLETDLGLLDTANADNLKGFVVIDGTDTYPIRTTLRWFSDENAYIRLYINDATEIISDSHTLDFVCWYETNLSVSGNFTHTDVIGSPENILQTDALKNGWQGSWIPVIPDGSGRLPLSRKSLVSSGTQTYTTDNGVSWGSAALPISTTTNDLSDAPAGMVLITTYTAFAKQTKPSTNKPVLNGLKGLSTAWAFNGFYLPEWGNIFMESLIGKVGVNATNAPVSMNYGLSSFFVEDGGTLVDNHSRYKPTHAPLSLGAPNNNSPAVKALPYQISDNGQCSLGIQANEMTYQSTLTSIPIVAGTPFSITAGTVSQLSGFDNQSMNGVWVYNVGSANTTWNAATLDGYTFDEYGNLLNVSTGQINTHSRLAFSGMGWGDDSTIKITASGSDTFVDLNGNTNLSVVHELALPLGWSKNRSRVGTQTDGVDL